MRWSLTGLRRAELLGPQRDAVLLEHPAHLPQRGAGRPALGQRGDLVQVGLLQRRRSGPSAAGRGATCVGAAARGAARARRGSAGSGAAGRRRPRRRTRGAPAGRAAPACRSAPAAWPCSARPLSAFSARRQRVEHPQHVGQHGPQRAPRGPARTASSRASYAASSRTGGRASTTSLHDGGAAVVEQRRRPRGTATRPAPSFSALVEAVEDRGLTGEREARAAAAGVRRAGAAPPASSSEPKTCSPTVAPSSTSAG